MEQMILKGKLLLTSLMGNLRAVQSGKMNWEQFVFAVKRQRAITETFKHAKLQRSGNRIFIHSYIPYFPSKFFDKTLINNSCDTYPLKPNYATVAITSRCPCNCVYCHAREYLDEEPSFEALKKTVQEIADLDFPLINFTGGEPLSRFNDLVELVSMAREHMDTRLFTSGCGATTERLAKLKEAGLNGMMVSLDHYEEEIHNRQRVNPNAFKSACNCIREGVRLGMHVEVVSCTTNSAINSGAVWKTVDFAETLGAHAIQLQAIRPSGRALRSNDDDFFFTPENRQKLIDFQLRENKGKRRISIVLPWYDEEAQHFGCTAVSGQHAYVDPRGYVMPCSLLALSLGNIKERSFKEIWEEFVAQCEHPVGECMVYRLAEKLREEDKLPLCPQRTYELWPELKALPPSGIAAKIEIKKGKAG